MGAWTLIFGMMGGGGAVENPVSMLRAEFLVGPALLLETQTGSALIVSRQTGPALTLEMRRPDAG